MKIIGLTGPSGSGKGELCAILEKFGIFSIDTDRVYHQLLAPPSACLDELSAHFGSQILNSDGSLDRAALAKKVFAPGAGSELEVLNRITHKYVLGKAREIISEFSQQGCSAVIVDAPALYESGFDKECDFCVAVIADKETRVERIMARDGISRDAAEKRINAQKPDSFYTEHARIVIYNNSNTSELQKQALEILRVLEAKND